MTKRQAEQVAKADIYSGIIFAIYELEKLGFDCSSYYKEIEESDEVNFDEDNINARNNLYKKLNIMEKMSKAYDKVCK